MSDTSVQSVAPQIDSKHESDLAEVNRIFAASSAEQRIGYALDQFPGQHIVSSSFGAQAAVMLALLTEQSPNLPVILVDTGYLFPETYRFVDELTTRLKLNLKVYQPTLSARWQESRYGQRWNMGREALGAYNRDAKVEPMQRALKELNVGTWFAGLRRSQSTSRTDTRYVARVDGRHKVHPIADWTERDVYRFLKERDLPYHPLWEHGYLSIGDTHTTRSIHEVGNIEQTRFFGLTRECGLHVTETPDAERI